MDIVPSYGNSKCISFIILKSKEYIIPNKLVKSITFLLKGKLHIKDILNMIIQNGYDRYIFMKEGKGYRSWICIMIKDLEVARNLDKDSTIIAIHTSGYYLVSFSKDIH
jgi:hypothetical protein